MDNAGCFQEENPKMQIPKLDSHFIILSMSLPKVSLEGEQSPLFCKGNTLCSQGHGFKVYSWDVFMSYFKASLGVLKLVAERGKTGILGFFLILFTKK